MKNELEVFMEKTAPCSRRGMSLVVADYFCDTTNVKFGHGTTMGVLVFHE